tara:strand:- start:1364 stop:1696 length:333 start_codon:yes stop_codon:yes gene_type:complete
MTRKRMVGPGGGDFAPSVSTVGGRVGGGKSIVTGRKSSVSKKSEAKGDEYILYITKKDGKQTHDMVRGTLAEAKDKAMKWSLAKGGRAVKSVKIRKYGSDALGKHPKGNY